MNTNLTIPNGIYEGYYWEDIADRDPAYVLEMSIEMDVPLRAVDRAKDNLDRNETVDPYEDYEYAQEQARAFGFVQENYNE